MDKPTLFWLTGFSGAGKTALGSRLHEFLRKKTEKVIFIDGDQMREVLNRRHVYSREDRLELAMTYSRLCKLLIDQGFSIVCCTISMFDECRAWNRLNIPHYVEIYIKAPMDELIKRDTKGIYRNGVSGLDNHVVGYNLHLEEPKNPDVIIMNDLLTSLDMIFADLCRQIECKLKIKD